MPKKIKPRLLEKRKPITTDGSQIGPGWYHPQRQSKIDNRASGVLRSSLDRSVNPAAPTMTRFEMRNVGPGTYSWVIASRHRGTKITTSDRWHLCGHMCQTETAVNPRLAPAKYAMDQYHAYGHERFVGQCNRSAERERQEAERQGNAGEGKYPLTIRERQEAVLNAQRPALDVMPDSVYWRNGALISDAPRFKWQKGPQNHTKMRPSTAPVTPTVKNVGSPEREEEDSEAADVKQIAPTSPVFANSCDQRPRTVMAWDDPRRLRAKFKIEESKMRHVPGQPLVSMGQAVDPRGLQWSFYSSTLRTL